MSQDRGAQWGGLGARRSSSRSGGMLRRGSNQSRRRVGEDGGGGGQEQFFDENDNPVNFREDYDRGSFYSGSRGGWNAGGEGGGGGTAIGPEGGPLPPNTVDDATFGNSTINTDDVADEIARLYVICEMAMPRPEEQGVQMTAQEAVRRKEQLEQTWELIREWLTAHPSPDERHLAATHLGHFSTTALHLVCKLSDPPPDVVNAMIECSPETVTWQDSNGWLPLHHACANGASGEVLSTLCDAYPEGKIAQDRRQRTPLHFAFFRADAAAPAGGEGGLDETLDTDVTVSFDDDFSSGGPGNGFGGRGSNRSRLSDGTGNSMADIVSLLSDTGAARLPDEGGMLPMHYACAYGTSTAVLDVLQGAFPEAIVSREHKGRTPLHLAMVNAHRAASPAVLRFLLSVGKGRNIVDVADNEGHLPLYLLAMASRFSPDQPEARTNAARCLRMYLDAGPKASADFLSALQALPEWLRDTAVVTEHVQKVLNRKIVRQFPTSILMMDGYFLLIIIVCFSYSSLYHIDYQFDRANSQLPNGWQVPVVMQIVGGGYFLLREMVQVVALVNLGTFRSWLTDSENYLDVTVIFLVFYYGALMASPEEFKGVNPAMFRNGIAVTQLVLYSAVISFLKSTLVDFAVFVGGVFYVVRGMAAFAVCLSVFLLAFAQMFQIVYTGDPLCDTEVVDGVMIYPNHTGYCFEDFPHCEFKFSLLKVYTMMMGEIGDECRYSTSTIAWVLYILYAFLVVILLSNVLIAIVTDSFGVIRNERAAMVFWSNRLDFVAEMDAISNFMRLVVFRGMCNKDQGGGPGGGGPPGAPPGSRLQETADGPATVVSGSASHPGMDGTPGDADGGAGGGADAEDEHETFRGWWTAVMSLFDQNLLTEMDVSYGSLEFWFYLTFRIFAIFVIIPLWMVVGLATAGWLWPPQVREWLFMQKRASLSRADVAEQVQTEIEQLKREIKAFRFELGKERTNDQRELQNMRAEVETVQRDVLSDLMQVREIMTTLFELTREKVIEREERAGMIGGGIGGAMQD